MAITVDPVYIASKVIIAQQRIMLAYQQGELPPEWATRDLNTYYPIWQTISEKTA